MAKTYRVGFASLVHDHVWWEVEKWKRLPNAEIVACGDMNAELREQFKRESGCRKTYDSWQELLEKEDLDIVQAASENSVAADIVEAAAAKGAHVVSEKPMAATLAQANRMIDAAKKAGTKLMINWPTAWSPAIRTMLNAIQGGEIGQPFYLKYRAAHNGPKEIGCSEYFWKWLYDEKLNGAGALMDYCCYSADLNATLFGLPNSVVGIRATLLKDYPIPDDNAIILMKYDHAFGVAEACWTQIVDTATPNPIAYGTEGSVVVSGGEVVLQRKGEPARKLEIRPLPEGETTGPEYLVKCIEEGRSVEGMCSAEVSRNAQAILEAGKRSADEGREIKLPLE
jgi:predicted dehydrogenase